MLGDRRNGPQLAGVAVGCCWALLVVSCAGHSPGRDETTPAASRASEQAPAPDGAAVVLVDLGTADAVATWTTVNDPVMGGRSTSRITFDDGLVFSGVLSLENNGGFASARSPQDPGFGRRAAGATSLGVQAQGDGKTYVMKVGVVDQPWSYIQRFPTEAGVSRRYDLPLGSFEPVGMRLDPAPDAPAVLDPSTIDQVSVYILDKQQGPFKITVGAIDAVTGAA